jgi:hypothetical protein
MISRKATILRAQVTGLARVCVLAGATRHLAVRALHHGPNIVCSYIRPVPMNDQLQDDDPIALIDSALVLPLSQATLDNLHVYRTQIQKGVIQTSNGR